MFRYTLPLFALFLGCDDLAEEEQRDGLLSDSLLEDGEAAQFDSAQHPDLLDLVTIDDLRDSAPDVGLDSALEESLCPSNYAPPQVIGALAEPLLEISGLVAARSSENLLWAHNDSGDRAQLYALDMTGALLGILEMMGVTALDLEDLAAAPCPDDSTKNCLWVADVGDNQQIRPEVTIHLMEEPRIGGPFGHLRQAPQRSLRLRYPQGAINSEALIVSPDGRQLWLFEKGGEERSRIYSGEITDEALISLRVVAELEPPGLSTPGGRLITGADLHPSGSRVALRVYSGSFEYRFDPGQTPSDLGSIEPLQIALGPLDEPQGEAIAYDTTGRGILSASEARDQQSGQPLHYYPCRE